MAGAGLGGSGASDRHPKGDFTFTARVFNSAPQDIQRWKEEKEKRKRLGKKAREITPIELAKTSLFYARMIVDEEWWEPKSDDTLSACANSIAKSVLTVQVFKVLFKEMKKIEEGLE